MIYVVDTTVLIDHLRGDERARAVISGGDRVRPNACFFGPDED